MNKQYCREETFICDCGDLLHCMKLCHFYEPDPDEEDVIYLTCVLIEGLSFWQRLKGSYYYLLNKRHPWGNFNTIIIEQSDTIRLASILKDLKPEKDIECSEVTISDYYSHNFVRFFIDKLEAEEDKTLPLLQVDVHLCPVKNLVKRFYRSIRYFLGFKSRFGPVDEFYIYKADAEKILYLINSYNILDKEYHKKDQQ